MDPLPKRPCGCAWLCLCLCPVPLLLLWHDEEEACFSLFAQCQVSMVPMSTGRRALQEAPHLSSCTGVEACSRSRERVGWRTLISSRPSSTLLEPLLLLLRLLQHEPGAETGLGSGAGAVFSVAQHDDAARAPATRDPFCAARVAATRRRSYSRPRRRSPSIATTRRKTPITLPANCPRDSMCQDEERKHESIVFQFQSIEAVRGQYGGCARQPGVPAGRAAPPGMAPGPADEPGLIRWDGQRTDARAVAHVHPAMIHPACASRCS